MVSVKFHVLFNILLILAFATRSPVFVGLYGLLSLGLIVTNIQVITSIDRNEALPLAIFVFILTMMLVINISRNETTLLHYLVSIMAYLGAIILTRNLENYVKGSAISLIVIQCIVIGYALVIGFDNFPITNPIEKMIPGASANGITSYLVLLQVNYSLSKYLIKKESTKLTPWLTIIIALMGFGRASIFTGVLIVIVINFTQLAHLKGVKLFIISSFFVGLSAIVVIFFWDEISFFVLSKTKLGHGFYDPHRESIIRDYTEKLNWFTFFFGCDYENTVISALYNNNPHITYIRSHHIFGLPYLLFMFSTVVMAVFSRKNIEEFLVTAAMFSIIGFRALTEPIIMPTLLDFYLFSMITFVAFGKKNSNNHLKKEPSLSKKRGISSTQIFH